MQRQTVYGIVILVVVLLIAALIAYCAPEKPMVPAPSMVPTAVNCCLEEVTR